MPGQRTRHHFGHPHTHIVLIAGDSIRLTQATNGKGVTPLTN